MRTILAILLTGLLTHQGTEPIRVNVRLVEVNVVALNKAGEPVADLTKDDRVRRPDRWFLSQFTFFPTKPWER